MASDRELAMIYVNQIANRKWVLGNLEYISPELPGIQQDTLGDIAIDAGVALFAYLADVFRMDFDTGIEAFQVIFVGYPGLPNTDLVFHYFDCMRLHKLWVNATRFLTEPPIAIATIVLQLVLRDAMVQNESYRKILVYAAYCRNLVTRKNTGAYFDPLAYLFTYKDPVRYLDSSGPIDRKHILSFYNTRLRNSIAHGNVAMINSQMMFRHPNDDNTKMLESTFEISAQNNELSEYIRADAEAQYQTQRVFFALANSLLGKHTDLMHSYFPNGFINDTLREIQQDIVNDPGSDKIWNHSLPN